MDIFKSGAKSSFAKKSRGMAKVLALGAGSLAIVFCLFIFFYFPSDLIIKVFSTVLPFTYLFAYSLCFSKISNKKLYGFIFYIFLYSSLSLLYIAYRFNFNSEFLIIMLVIYSIILIALPTPKQVISYFIIIFIPLEVTLLISGISWGFFLLITVSFAYMFALSYVISAQKKKLNQRNQQNAEVLKTLVNNTNDAMFLIDYLSKKILDLNQRAIEIFGLDDDNDKEIRSKTYYELFANEDYIKANKNEITREISQFGYYHSEVLFKRKGDNEFLGDIFLSPFNAAKGNYYLIQIKQLTTKNKIDS